MQFSNAWLVVFSLMAGSLVLGAAPPSKQQRAGSIRCEIWSNLDGPQITDTLAAGDLDSPPTQSRLLDSLELNPAPQSPQACALRGYVVAPLTGDYRFMIAANDTALLYLSTDQSPVHRKNIASVPIAVGVHDFTRYAAQTSKVVKLIAGQRYFIEALMKNGDGPGWVSVGWILPDGRVESPVPGRCLIPALDHITPPETALGKPELTLKPEVPQNLRPGFHKFPLAAHIEWPTESLDMSYLVYLPYTFNSTTDQRPLLVFLHGNSHQGTSLWGVLNEGPCAYLMGNQDLREWFPMIGLFPQLPPDWRWDRAGAPQAVNALIEQVCERYPRINRKRIYLTGLSMGGKGTWLTALDSPSTFAAIATMSAVAVRPQEAKIKLADMKDIQILCGADDTDFANGSKEMFDALQPVLGDRVHFKAVEHMGHSVWTQYYPRQEFYESLMRYTN